MAQTPPSGAGLSGALDLSGLGQSGTSRPGSSGSANGLVFEGTDAGFQEFLDLSARVPVIVDLWSDERTDGLEDAVVAYGGRLALVAVDQRSNPQLAQAFQTGSAPTVAAIIGGRPVSLFQGSVPAEQLGQVLDQVLELAAQNGVTGRLDAPDQPDPEAEDSTPLPPHHREAEDALERGDYDGALAEYDKALAENPHDAAATTGKARVALVARLADVDAEQVRHAAAEAPRSVAAQLIVADLDLSGGHVEDAFDRLLTLFPTLSAEEKEGVRARLVDYFAVVGGDDPRVTKARARLTSLLF